MLSKIFKLTLIAVVLAGVSHLLPATADAWSLNPFASKEEKKTNATYTSNKSTTSGNTAANKSFWEKIGLAKSKPQTQKPSYAVPRQKIAPARKKENKSWFSWLQPEEKKDEKPGNVVDWLGTTNRPDL